MTDNNNKMSLNSMLNVCCGPQNSVGAVTAPQPQFLQQDQGSFASTSSMQQQSTKTQSTGMPGAGLMSTVTGVMRDAVSSFSGGSSEMDRLNASLITGKGETKQTFGEIIVRNALPNVAVFPASSKTGLATIRALTSYPYRNSCAKIQCILRTPDQIPLILAELGAHVSDAISWSFADYTDERSMTAAFIGVDRLLLVPPSTQDRSELTCQGLQAARLAGIKHVVLLSAVVAQHPNTMFGGQFRRMETCLEAMRPNVNYTIMRMAWFMDNFLDMAPDLVANSRFLSSWGASGFSPVCLADIGRTTAAVLSAPKTSDMHFNRTFHITGPESLSGARMAEVFTRVLKRQISYQDLPHEDMKRVYVEGMKIPEWQADGYVEMNDLFKQGGAAAFSTDVAMLTGGNQTTLERFLMSKRWYFTGHRSPLTVVMPASGRVGTQTLVALMSDPSHGRIRAVVHNTNAQSALQARFPNAANLEIVNGDFEYEASVRNAFDGADTVMIIPPEKLDRFGAIDAAINIAKELGASHTVLFSVSKGLDQTAIGRKFNAWERVLEHHSNAYAIVQCTFFTDLMFHFAEQIKRPEHRVHHWLGTGRFCPVDSRDVGAANAAVLREGPLVHHGQTYSLYGPQALSFQEMLDKLSIVLGYQITSQPDVTSEQVRDTMEGKLPSFNIAEIVQAQEVVGMGRDQGVTPDLLKLVGHAHTVQAFFEDNKAAFTGPPASTMGTPQRSPMMTKPMMTDTSSPTSTVMSAVSPSTTTYTTTVIDQTFATTTPLKFDESPTRIPETSIDQSAQVTSEGSSVEIKPGATAIPVAPTQPAVVET